MPSRIRHTIDNAVNIRRPRSLGNRCGKSLGVFVAVCATTMMLALFCKPATAQTVQVGDWPAPLRVVAEELPPASDAEFVESEGGGPWLSLSDLDAQSLIDLRRDPWIRFGSRLSTEPDEQRSDDEPSSSASGAAGYGIRTRDFGSAPPSDKPKARPTTNITVELQSDFAWFDQSQENQATVGEIPDGAFFRRSRIGIFGALYETVEYRLEYDFAEEARPRFLDNWIALTDIPIVRNLIVGHFFEPFSLERYTPNRFITFNERSLADTFAPARNMGMMLYGHALDDRLTFGLGGFRSNSNDYGEDVSYRSGYAGTAHATYLAWFRELNEYQVSLLHLGGSFSYRTSGDDPVRYATRPSIRMRQQGVGGVPVFVDTGEMPDVSQIYLAGLEVAWAHGPFSVQSEYIQSQLVRTGNDNPTFHAGYVYGSWFVTGEGRSYSPTSILGRFREGIFQRITPRSNVFDRSERQGWTGLGAVELAVRWSYIDLNDAGVRGGYMEDMTYGVNWYLNKHTRVSLNYVRPDLHDPDQGQSDANMYSLRFQFEF